MEERESIWAVPRPVLALYRIVFSVLVIVSTGIVAWREIFINTGDGFFGTFTAIGEGASPYIIMSAGYTVIFVEGIYMLAEWLIKDRYLRRGREERAKREREAFERFGVDVNGVRMLPDTEEVRRFLNGESEE